MCKFVRKVMNELYIDLDPSSASDEESTTTKWTWTKLPMGARYTGMKKIVEVNAIEMFVCVWIIGLCLLRFCVL